MQVRVPWTQAWLCTKDFHQKCTGAGVAAKVAVPSNAAQRGEARTYLHQTWTEESLDYGVTWTELLDSRDLARRAERRPKGPVMQLFGACGCREKIPSTHGRFLRSFWCREEADYPHSMHKQEKHSRRRQDQRYRVAVVVFATMLQVCRLPARSAVDSLSEGEERDAEELG
ncbi:hypothetical protein NDU88_000190 [Pleurodeles waltl]|uniref:Uncharacterized protein n=1 Tax=Pleurodeles waltl TaxID=8319 RepID=A0AAV7V6V5_PLEWA|nr:hypothetical protein NDU88_000190 [Pleurodeles waltl]